MDNKTKILKIAKANNGMFTSTMLTDAGIPRGSLKYLVDNGVLENIMRGVYVLPDFFEDEMFSFQSRYKRGIYSLNSALFLHDLSDRTPQKFNMTFPNSYNLTKPKEEGLLCVRAVDKFYSLGVTSCKTQYGNAVRVYNAERTLCDILRPQFHVDGQTIGNAFKMYVKKKDKDLVLLMRYAEMMHVYSKVYTFLEVLL